MGLVLAEPEAIAGKAKLFEVKIDVGAAEPISVITNATNVKAGLKVVVATIGAEVNGEEIKKCVVGGRPSFGMLCDAPMLGWVGGGAGAAVTLGDEFEIGSRPPASRPRKG